MQLKSCLAVALVAGSMTSVALAQPRANPKATGSAGVNEQHRQAALVAGARPHYPDEFRKVALINNEIVPLGPWMPYTHPTNGDAGTPTICWDAYHDQGGHAPNTAPETGRWLFAWTTTPTFQYDYTEAQLAIPVNGILPAARSIGAKYFDYLSYDKAGGDQFFSIFTSESYSDTVLPSDPSWGVFPGWEFHATAVAPGSFYYWPLALTDPNIWPLPSDGNGGVIVRTFRDAAHTLPAQLYQFAMWGTQEHTTPPPSPAKIGTSGTNQWDDECTGDVCNTGLTTNIPDGAWSLACENKTWDYGAAYQPEPFTFCVDLGFDAPATQACYANCDQSTGDPALNANDFQCFLNAYAIAPTLPNDQQITDYANCDGSTGNPALNANDFQCFLNAFAVGCS
jgi:hypothetical protein